MPGGLRAEVHQDGKLPAQPARFLHDQPELHSRAAKGVRSIGVDRGEIQHPPTDGWFGKCDRKVCLYSRNAPSFVVEHDHWTDDQLDVHPIYRDFFRPRGLGWSAGTGLMMPTGDNIVFSVERAFSRGPVEKNHVETLNELRPHLARAAFIAARLGLKSATGASETLSQLGLPALVLDESGFVLEANAQMGELAGSLNWQSQQRLFLQNAEANTLLQKALPALNNSGVTAVSSFPMKGADGRAAHVAHLVPMRRAAQDIFTRAYALLIFTPVTTKRSPPVELLRSLFDLTVAEARVARGLASGQSLDEVAEQGGVSRNTVRTQLQQVMGKMGCERQAEVTAMLANVTVH